MASYIEGMNHTPYQPGLQMVDNYIRHVVPEVVPRRDFESAFSVEGKGLLYLLPHLSKNFAPQQIASLDSHIKQKLLPRV